MQGGGYGAGTSDGSWVYRCCYSGNGGRAVVGGGGAPRVLKTWCEDDSI